MHHIDVDDHVVRQFIIGNVSNHPQDIARLVMEQFGLSRHIVNKRLRLLVRDGIIEGWGNTKARKYTLKPKADKRFELPISPDLEEDRVWREYVSEVLKAVLPNVFNICHHGFTEIFNNVIEHSSGKVVSVEVRYTLAQIGMCISDDGVGIFHKIKTELGLEGERHAILELSKGKLTTDSTRHTGEGIFFASRLFDEFYILSGELAFGHKGNDAWRLEHRQESRMGTLVKMMIHPNSQRTAKEVFDRYTVELEDYRFTKTHVPVALVQYDNENLVSRSQAKRLLARFDQFKEVLLDFAGVQAIGQAFADEIFRVFRNRHPNIRLVWINANKEVEWMIHRVMPETSGVKNRGRDAG